jgi:hypothetical protein
MASSDSTCEAAGRWERDLGAIDMRQIAPTLANLLQVKLTAAKQSPLNLCL